MINYNSQITFLHLVTYCRIFVGDVTELMFAYVAALYKCQLFVDQTITT